MARGALFTIGYEGRELAELIAMLSAKRIDRVIDIRELPLSRRRGFSKTPLGDALRGSGIEYVHMREAGNPYRKQKDVLTPTKLLAKYERHLEKSEDIVEHVTETARGCRAALLCYEAEPGVCHRSVLAPRVAQLLGCSVQDL
jgi:uncharacterized protein (DUF488 family)